MINNKIVYDYDCKGDSLFVYCVEPYEYEVSVELDNNVILDLDNNGKPMAFEFLNASEIFKLDKSYFKNLVHITIQACITEEAICLKVQLLVLIHNKNHVFGVDRITSNSDNIPAMETELVTA